MRNRALMKVTVYGATHGHVTTIKPRRAAEIRAM